MIFKLTTEIFIERSKGVFGDSFGYDRVSCNGGRDVVTLKCPVHGYFDIVAVAHLRSPTGCTKCSNEMAATKLRQTTEGFIQKSKEKYGDLLIYDKVVYELSDIPVILGCKIHGYFKQTPNNHFKTEAVNPCRKCIMTEVNASKKYTKEEFIKLANDKHGGFYKYDKLDYKGISRKVKIECRKHGYFWQLATTHLTGSGCPKCANERISNHFTRPEDDVRKAMVEVHGDTYSYDKLGYEHMGKMVTITCKEHGDFKMRPATHLRGGKCPYCTRKIRTADTFKEDAQKIHGDKYTYSAIYHKSKVRIKCNKCKSYFDTHPGRHLRGSGCPNLCYVDKQNVVQRAAKLFDIFIKGTFPYDTAGKRETTEIIMDTIYERIGDDFNFLSMPGNGRELKYMVNAFNLNVPGSLGVEIDGTHCKVLQRLWQKLKLGLPMKKGNIDQMILENSIDNTFDVTHLDYNGFLTPGRQKAINKQVMNAPDNGLVFVTLNTNRRGVGLEYPAGKLPVEAGEIIMHQPYTGMRGAKMETFGILKPGFVY